MAKENWSSEVRAAVPPPQFRPDLVEKIYAAELGGGPTAQRLKRVMLLEISQYLENYLWPHFDAATATDAHVMSILVRGTLHVLNALQRVSPHHPGHKVVTAPPAFAGHGEREVPRGCAGLGRLCVAAGCAAEPVRADIRAACARRRAWWACLVHTRARDVPAVRHPRLPEPGERGRAQAGAAAGVAAAVARAVTWPPAGAVARSKLVHCTASTAAEHRPVWRFHMAVRSSPAQRHVRTAVVPMLAVRPRSWSCRHTRCW